MVCDKKNTYLVNLISGPGAGKSCLAAALFVNFKIKGYSAEYVQEYAKNLVWDQDFDTLNNQFYVSKEQTKLFSRLQGIVDIIVTDGSILHGLCYNKINEYNTSNVEKTEKFIIENYNKFNNINIFINRNNIEYEQSGRIQTLTEAKEIDTLLLNILNDHKIDYTIFDSNINDFAHDIADHVLNIIKKK